MAVCTLCAFAQTTHTPPHPFTFETTKWNFGEIEETGGKVNHTFIFTNTSSKPQSIEHVKTSCGCTTTLYSREPVLPGRTGEIEVVFDPVKQPGRFQKNIRITTNGGKSVYNLSISGMVKPRTKPIDEAFPYRLSAKGLQMDANKANFGYVYHNTETKKIINLVNTSDKDIEINIVPTHVNSGKLSIDYPKILKPDEKGKLLLTYYIDGKDNIYGSLKDELEISVKGNGEVQKINVEGIAVEPKNKQEKQPQLRYQPSLINFGKQKDGEMLSSTFTIVNDGNAPLIIRKIETEGYIQSDIKTGNTLKPKEKRKVNVRFKPESRKGKQTGNIILITNDPIRPMREIKIEVIII